MKRDIMLPAKVEALCCKLCSTPRQQLYLLQTVFKGISRTRSCKANAV